MGTYLPILTQFRHKKRYMYSGSNNKFCCLDVIFMQLKFFPKIVLNSWTPYETSYFLCLYLEILALCWLSFFSVSWAYVGPLCSYNIGPTCCLWYLLLINTQNKNIYHFANYNVIYHKMSKLFMPSNHGYFIHLCYMCAATDSDNHIKNETLMYMHFRETNNTLPPPPPKKKKKNNNNYNNYVVRVTQSIMQTVVLT